jgi:2'-5' RNA ligase
MTKSNIILMCLKRPFLPHITLGRLAKPGWKSISFQQEAKEFNQLVSRITLFESQLSPEGSHYSALHEFPLEATSGITLQV